jgi:hypothetical protein
MAAPAERYYAMWQQYGCCLCNVTVMERPSMRSGAASYRQSRQWAARSSSDLSEFVIASITVRLADIIEHCQHELVSADHVDQPVHQSRHVDVADECARHQVAACLGLGIERAVDAWRYGLSLGGPLSTSPCKLSSTADVSPNRLTDC